MPPGAVRPNQPEDPTEGDDQPHSGKQHHGKIDRHMGAVTMDNVVEELSDTGQLEQPAEHEVGENRQRGNCSDNQRERRDQRTDLQIHPPAVGGQHHTDKDEADERKNEFHLGHG